MVENLLSFSLLSIPNWAGPLLKKTGFKTYDKNPAPKLHESACPQAQLVLLNITNPLYWWCLLLHFPNKNWQYSGSLFPIHSSQCFLVMNKKVFQVKEQILQISGTILNNFNSDSVHLTFT